MKIYLRIVILGIITLNWTLPVSGQSMYSNHKQLSQKLSTLGKDYPGQCKVSSLIKTDGGKDIWLVTIGSGDTDNKPAVAIVGGVQGNYILGTELATGIAEAILKNSGEAGIRDLLEKITFYILPDVSPDAREQFFNGQKYERSINARSTDDDRDFTSDEDPFEDLNSDGYITLIRIKDPSGRFIESSEDKRIMVQADLSKGETGGYLVYSEGFDNDDDGKYNEDAEGGVNFNRNLTFNYEEFGTNAGLYPVSEPETKAVMDFLFDRFNIYTVFTFGPQDNLGQPMKSDRPERAGSDQLQQQSQGPEQARMRMNRKFSSILKTDEIINKFVSDKYHDITGAKGAPVSETTPGNFMDWVYFHYGRYSFSTPGWWFPVEKEKNSEASYLKYAEKKGIKDEFISVD